jgi:hypothetical protein
MVKFELDEGQHVEGGHREGGCLWARQEQPAACGDFPPLPLQCGVTHVSGACISTGGCCSVTCAPSLARLCREFPSGLLASGRSGKMSHSVWSLFVGTSASGCCIFDLDEGRDCGLLAAQMACAVSPIKGKHIF